MSVENDLRCFRYFGSKCDASPSPPNDIASQRARHVCFCCPLGPIVELGRAVTEFEGKTLPTVRALVHAMETLDKYLTIAMHSTALAFARQEPGPYLLKRPNLTTEPGNSTQPIGFDTVLSTTEIDPFASQWRLVLVKKREGNPYEDRMSIGRASNCDLVVRVPFISKIQAHIIVDGDGNYSLRAQNSANPTLLNGRVVGANESSPLKYGDQLSFGPMKFEFVDATRLHKVLVSEVRRTSLVSC